MRTKEEGVAWRVFEFLKYVKRRILNLFKFGLPFLSPTVLRKERDPPSSVEAGSENLPCPRDSAFLRRGNGKLGGGGGILV